MRSIEDRLQRQATPEPRRPLSSGFANSVMQHISHSGESRNPNRKHWIPAFARMTRTLTKPVAAGLIITGVALLAGTTYAGMQWLLPHNTVRTDTITTLPNGNIRFWVHSDSCQGQGMNDATDNYYEIKAGSKLTPQELSDDIEVTCETDGLPVLFPDVIKNYKKGQTPNYKLGDKQYFTPYVEVVAVDKDTLTINTALNGESFKNVKVPLDKNAEAFYRGDAINPQSIKAGDWITLVSYTTALGQAYSTETLPVDEISKMSENGLPIGTRVEGFIKHRTNPIKANEMYETMGTDWTRLEKDSKSPDGWRQIVPLH